MLGNVSVGAGQQADRLFEHRIFGEIRGRKGVAFDVIDHQKAGFVMDHCRRNTRRMGRLACAKFVETHDLMHRNISIDAHPRFAQAVLNQKIAICDATFKGGNRNVALRDSKLFSSVAPACGPGQLRRNWADQKDWSAHRKTGMVQPTGPAFLNGIQLHATPQASTPNKLSSVKPQCRDNRISKIQREKFDLINGQHHSDRAIQFRCFSTQRRVK